METNNLKELKTFHNQIVRAKIARLVTSGLLAVSIAFVLAFLTISSLDAPLTFSLYAFAASIPLLSFIIVIVSTVLSHSKIEDSNIRDLKFPEYYRKLYIIGLFVSFLGIASIFLHYSVKILVIFIVASIIVFRAYQTMSPWLEENIKINKEDQDKSKTNIK